MLRRTRAEPPICTRSGRSALISWGAQNRLLYLAGFITTLATGTRRQRIGDLAARAAMAWAGRGRSLALLPLASVVLAAVVFPVSRSAWAGGIQACHDHGIWFACLAGWSAGIAHGGTGTGNLVPPAEVLLEAGGQGQPVGAGERGVVGGARRGFTAARRTGRGGRAIVVSGRAVLAG